LALYILFRFCCFLFNFRVTNTKLKTAKAVNYIVVNEIDCDRNSWTDAEADAGTCGAAALRRGGLSGATRIRRAGGRGGADQQRGRSDADSRGPPPHAAAPQPQKQPRPLPRTGRGFRLGRRTPLRTRGDARRSAASAARGPLTLHI